jgi:NCS1 family nucleobase:cation symporter-1
MAPALVEHFRLQIEPGSFACGIDGLPSNKDLDPVPL